jgi:hypothetical protein
MTAYGNRILDEASLPITRPRQSPPRVVSGTDEYVAAVQQISHERLADLAAQVQTARQRETILWWLFVLAFTLTLAAGGAGVALILLGSLKVAIASGAAGLLPGCSSAWLRRECTVRSKDRQAIEEKMEGEFRLQQAAAVITELPQGTQKEKFQVDYARKILSRIPK